MTNPPTTLVKTVLGSNNIFFKFISNYQAWLRVVGVKNQHGAYNSIETYDDQISALIESEISSKEFRKNWARLIQKIYKVNPLVCSKCFGSMKIISFIEDEQLVKKILKHFNLWDVKCKLPSCANGPPPETFIIYDQLSPPGADDYLTDADYPIETYF